MAPLVRTIAGRQFLALSIALWVWAASAGMTSGNPAITHRRYRPTDRNAKSENRKAERKNRKAEFGNPKSKIQNLKSSRFTGGTPNLLASAETSYSTFLGGAGFDVATDVAVDGAGNVYVTGYSNSSDFASSAPGLSLPGGGTCGDGLDTYPCFDAFVAKFDSTGQSLVYLARFGGSGDDYAAGIAIDGFGNVYVTGYTNSTDFPTSHTLQAHPGGGTCGVMTTTVPCYDAFVAELDLSGSTLVYATYLGGSADDFGQGIVVDSAGNATVVGFTASADFPTRGALQSSHRGGSYDAFVAMLGPAGASLVYSTFLGGTGEDYGSKVALDSTGAAFVTGYTNSADFPVDNAFQSSIGGGTCGAAPNTSPCFDAFATKLSGDGTALLYSTYLGGSGGDYGYGIAVDDEKNAYVTGLTTSTNFPVTPGALQATGGGTTVDAFVAKLDAEGSSALYSTYLGGIGAEAGWDVAVDSEGNAYVGGYTYGAGFPLTNPVQAASGGFYDAFIAKLNAAGSALVFSTYLGGSGNEKAHGLALDKWGNAYLAGETFSTDFPTTSGTLQPLYGGGAFDGFVTKLIGPEVVPGAGSLSLSDLTFGNQLVGTSSAPQSVTLSNIGELPLALSSIVTSGDFESTTSCSTSLDPAASCTIQVSFAPTGRGLRQGTLTIYPEPPASPLSVNLTGNGVAPEMNLSPSAVEFGPQVVYTASPHQTVTLANSGDAYLVLTRIEISGDFTQTNTCEGGLSAGQTCAVRVVFDPKVAGTRTGSLTFTNSLPYDVASVALSGTGSDFSISASPGARSITAGQAATFTIGLSPAGGFHETVTLACSGAPKAATCSLSPASAALDGSNTITSTLTVTTTGASRTLPLPGNGMPGQFLNTGLYLFFWLCAALALVSRGGSVGAGWPPRLAVPWLLRGAFALMLVALGVSCGGGSTAPPPPVRQGTTPGKYTLTVTAASAVLTRTTTLTVTVQ